MLKKILSISGKPGLYKLVSQAKNMLIVESLTDKKRMPCYGSERVIALGDIAMYTDDEEIPLREVLETIKSKHEGGKVDIDYKKASNKELFGFLEEVLPNYDRDRVHASDVKKLIQWYNILVSSGVEFTEEKKEE